ncbi:ABC transporter ATP-binding protein [Candidatus Uhrbacteria bacterium]|nr:ABC transporter ATP-binding protein [Candidatus Uhrbacteria bacterium]
MSHNPVVEITGVRHGYEQTPVLHGVNLSVHEGEFVTVVGPSGCGKSTLLGLLVGAEQPWEGSIMVAGELKTMPDRRCTIVYQQYSLFPHLTVFENIVFGLCAQRLRTLTNHNEESAHVWQYLRDMGLEDAAVKYPYQLSGGMEQRVAIAQAVITHPKVLLLDEPFSALDSARRQQMQQFLLDVYQREKMTIVFVTHDLPEAIYLGTRVIKLSKDRSQQAGSRIVLDTPIGYPHPRPIEFKSSAEFQRLLNTLEQPGSGQRQ